MKTKGWIALLAVLCFGLTSVAQKEAPKAVTEALSKAYTGSQITGAKSSDGQVWALNFSDRNGEHRAEFQADGTWLNTRTSVELSELPKPVADVLNSNFEGFIAYNAAKYNAPGIEGYSVKLRNGANLMDVIVDEEGNVLKPSTME